MSTTFWIQLLGVIFGLAMGYFTFVKYKRKELAMQEFWMWCVVWVVLVAVALVPSILDPIIAPLNFYRRLDFFVVLGFFVLLGMAFYNYTLTKRLHAKLERFVRDDAVKGAPFILDSASSSHARNKTKEEEE